MGTEIQITSKNYISFLFTYSYLALFHLSVVSILNELNYRICISKQVLQDILKHAVTETNF